LDASEGDGSVTIDAGCTPGTGGSVDSGPGPTGGCGTILVEGKTLSPEEMEQYSCGGTTGGRSTRATVTGLTNFTKYAIAVVASDLVENVGALSQVQCAVPQPVNGFDEAYRNAGGTAGGASFCSISRLSTAATAKLGPGVALLLALLALFSWRRRVAVASRG
jgi:MYXO-CTERM domain-containing protein